MSWEIVSTSQYEGKTLRVLNAAQVPHFFKNVWKSHIKKTLEQSLTEQLSDIFKATRKDSSLSHQEQVKNVAKKNQANMI